MAARFQHWDRDRNGHIERSDLKHAVRRVGEASGRPGLMDEASRAAGIRDLCRTAEDDGTFCYSFFKAVGLK